MASLQQKCRHIALKSSPTTSLTLQSKIPKFSVPLLTHSRYWYSVTKVDNNCNLHILPGTGLTRAAAEYPCRSRRDTTDSLMNRRVLTSWRREVHLAVNGLISVFIGTKSCDKIPKPHTDMFITTQLQDRRLRRRSTHLGHPTKWGKDPNDLT